MEVLLADRDVLLFANEAFYRAFTDRDMDVMEHVWASEAPVCCIHPGWEAIHGHDDVIEQYPRKLALDPKQSRVAGDPLPCCRRRDLG